MPGVIATRAAPELVQLNVLLPPRPMLDGLAVNEPIVFAFTASTVTVAVAVFDPTPLMAVSV